MTASSPDRGHVRSLPARFLAHSAQRSWQEVVAGEAGPAATSAGNTIAWTGAPCRARHGSATGRKESTDAGDGTHHGEDGVRGRPVLRRQAVDHRSRTPNGSEGSDSLQTLLIASTVAHGLTSLVGRWTPCVLGQITR
jgi:hypothetical protein